MRPEFHILLIEDSRSDVKIIERALAEGNVPHRLTVLCDGSHALEYLIRLADPDAEAETGERLEPDLILLDLNLPGLDGCQVLTRIKTHPVLRALPVVVLTTSRSDDDIYQTYQAGANSFIQKPAEYPSYRDLVQTLRTYWHETAIRPRLTRPPA